MTSSAKVLYVLVFCLFCGSPVGAQQPGPGDVAALLTQLDNPTLQPVALKALGEMGEAAADAIPTLRTLMRRPSPVETRLLAIQAIGKMGKYRIQALPELTAGLADAVSGVECARVFAELGGDARSALPQLVAFILKDGDLDGFAAKALLNLGQDAGAAVPTLRGALRSKNGSTRAAAARALGRLKLLAQEAGPDLVTAALSGNMAAAKALVELGTNEPIQGIIEALDDSNHKTRYWAVRSLWKMGDHARSARSSLTRLAFKDPNRDVRDLAFNLLINLNTLSIPETREALADRATWDRAIAFLRHVGPLARVILPDLLKYFVEFPMSEWDKAELGSLIAKLGRGDVVFPFMVELAARTDLSNSEPGQEVEIYAIQELGGFGSAAAGAIPLLLDLAFTHPNPEGRDQATESLAALCRVASAKYADPVWERVLTAQADSDRWSRHVAVRVLPSFFQTRRESVVTHLKTRATKDSDSWIRQLAVRGLSTLKSKEVISEIRLALTDPEDSVRTEAVEAIAQFGEATLQDLVDFLAKSPPDGFSVRAAVTAIANLGAAAERAIPQLELTKETSKDSEIQLLIAYSINEIRDAVLLKK